MLSVDPPTSTRPTRDSLSMARAGQTTETPDEEGKKQLRTGKSRKTNEKFKPSINCSHVTYCCDLTEDVTSPPLNLCWLGQKSIVPYVAAA